VKSVLVEKVTISSKGQITIPSKLRKDLNLTEGEQLLVVREDDTMRFIPIPKLSKLAGVDKEIFKGRKPSAELKAMRKEWDRELDKRIQQM
jgi:AbrB family looped-hinge helix DNA binding protein